jgi:CheY-like chemotaxis protein
LAPLSTSLELLQLSENLDPKAQRVCTVMERQLEQLVRLVDDLSAAASKNTSAGAPPTMPDDSAPPCRRILIVDDTPASAFVLGQLLEKLGQQVTTAHDAQAGLDRARSERPDVVISDIGMPHMDGYEFARALRQCPDARHAFLVALTGYGTDCDKQKARDAGFDHHLVKPVGIDALHELLAALPARASV